MPKLSRPLFLREGGEGVAKKWVWLRKPGAGVKEGFTCELAVVYTVSRVFATAALTL